MMFHSILFKSTEDQIKEETLEEPDFFIDLNLDQIINAITAGRQEYNLKPFFFTSLKDIDSINYRQEIMQDLENEILFKNIKSFAQKMHVLCCNFALTDKLYCKYNKGGWFLNTVNTYCKTINCLVDDLSVTELKSRGFLAFRKYLISYVDSVDFTTLFTETKKLKADLSTIKYCLFIKGNSIEVTKYKSEIDYSDIVEKTFKKFQQGEVKDYTIDLRHTSNMNHVEEGVMDLVTKLYPGIFLNLDDYCTKNSNFFDKTINVFNREIQFYIAYLEYLNKFKHHRYKFCFPKFSTSSKEIYDYEGFDLALANKLLTENLPVVCNDFYLKNNERVFVVSGHNQGGKTTFARTFGQLHYLASLGCPVPGRKAQLFLFDRIFTHFEREEDIKDCRGKLQDDLVRIYNILNQSTTNSIVIMNEIFNSTTLLDATSLSKKIMDKIIDLDLLSVWVTFIGELASASEQTVSMVSTISPDNPALRTYKIERKPADGLSYAISIAEKYRLTYNCLKERIKS